MIICGQYLEVNWDLKPTISTYKNFLQPVLCRKNKMAASLVLIYCPGDWHLNLCTEKELNGTFLVSCVFATGIVLET